MCSSLRVRKIGGSGILPRRATSDSIGYDLIAPQFSIIPKKAQQVVFLNLAIQVPDGTYGQIASRSGLAAKKNIHVGAGVVDPGYRGDVGVLLINHGEEDFIIRRGDAIAQLVLEQCKVVDVVEVESLEETERGVRGFGSTSMCGSLDSDPRNKFLKLARFSPSIVVDELHPNHVNNIQLGSCDVVDSRNEN